MKRYLWLVATLLLIIPTFFSMLKPGIQNIQDNMQYFRIYEMEKCVLDGQIPCRWVPDMGYGFGYPLYLYYSPGPYYLGLMFHSLGFQYVDCVKILFILGFIVSAIGVYWLILTLMSSPKTAFIGTLLYIYAPVRAVQVYVRGSLGEFLAMAIFPFLFLFSYRIIKDLGKNNVFWLGLSLAMMLLTHNLMTVAIMPVLFIWSVYLAFMDDKLKKLVDILWGILLGVGLSAFYVLPLIFERQYVHLESMTGGYFDYRQHFVNLYQLFISNHWGYGSSQLGPNDDLSLSVGVVQWVLALASVILGLFNYKKSSKNLGIIMLLSGISLFLMFLMHEKSSFIWSSLSFLAMFQFPWRFLVVCAFLLSILGSFAINNFKGLIKSIIIGMVTIWLLVTYSNNFRPQIWSKISDAELLSGKEFVKQQTASIFDYLPKSATLPPNYEAPLVPEILGGEARIGKYDKGSNWQEGEIDVISDTAKIRVPMFDFLGMKVIDNGKNINFGHTDCRLQPYCFGQISFDLDKGAHQIKIRLGKTWPRVLGDILSLFSIFGIIVFVFKKYEN